MLKLLSIITVVSLLATLVNSHGRLLVPTSRSEFCNSRDSRNITQRCNDRDWQYCEFVTNQYYYRGGRCDVCGNNNFPSEQWYYAQNTKLTGPIKATYNSGDKILLTVVIGNHHGYMRVKLCKLNSPTDQVTEKCLNENLLRIESKYPSHANQSYFIDNYTLYTPHLGYAIQYEAEIYAYLPQGLSCNNCVLRWEWHTTDQLMACKYQNRTDARNVYNKDYSDSPCLTQMFRTCSDIKINPIANQVYKPIPYVFKNPQPVFSCLIQRNERSNGPIKHLPPPDPLANKGTGMVCIISEEKYNSTNRDNNYVRTQFCPTCYENCFFAGKTCPSDCYCRWYNRYPEATLTNLKF